MRSHVAVLMLALVLPCSAEPFKHDRGFIAPAPPSWTVESDGSTWYVLDSTARTGRSVTGHMQHWAWVYRERPGAARQENLYAVQNCGADSGLLYEVDREGRPQDTIPVMTWTKTGNRVVDHLARLVCLAALHRALNIPPGPQQRLSPDAI
jgi:hypothetical protein